MNVLVVCGGALRGLGAIVAMLALGPTPIVFFSVQALGGLLEAAVSRTLLFHVAPGGASGLAGGGRLLASELHFAGGMAVSAIIATVIGEVDKLILSHRLSLADFGLFSLVVSICTGIAMVAPPFVQAMQPRLTILVARNQRAEFARTYRIAQSTMLALVGGLTGTIAVHASSLLLAWTGDPATARFSLVLSLYALGTGAWSLLFLPFLLQYAFGRMRLHLWGFVLYGLVQIPIEIYATLVHGALGAGIVWLAGNVAFLIGLGTLAVRRFLTPDERGGLLRDTLTGCAVMLGVLTVTLDLPLPGNRFETLFILGAVAAGTGLLGGASSKPLRDAVTSQWIRRHGRSLDE